MPRKKISKTTDGKYVGYVMVHEQWGAYLGSSDNMHFWSKLDPMEQTHAIAFHDPADAIALTDAFDLTLRKHVTYFQVETAEIDYASEEECKAAGIPGWVKDASR